MRRRPRHLRPPIAGFFSSPRPRLADMASELGKQGMLSQLGRLKDAGRITPTQVSIGKLSSVPSPSPSPASAGPSSAPPASRSSTRSCAREQPSVGAGLRGALRVRQLIIGQALTGERLPARCAWPQSRRITTRVGERRTTSRSLPSRRAAQTRDMGSHRGCAPACRRGRTTVRTPWSLGVVEGRGEQPVLEPLAAPQLGDVEARWTRRRSRRPASSPRNAGAGVVLAGLAPPSAGWPST